MKKIADFLKPNILIVFGALLFLYYLNWTSYEEGLLALGIIAIIFSIYYLGIGILGVVIGDKFSPILKKVFDIISISLFVLFIFVYTLIFTINYAEAEMMGPTSWVIRIVTFIVVWSVLPVFIVSKFIDKPIFARLTYLLAAVFALVLLLDILFSFEGTANPLGAIDLLKTVIYGAFVFYLFSSLKKADDAPQQVEEQKEEPQEEPAQE